jgi:hypothetical protein
MVDYKKLICILQVFVIVLFIFNAVLIKDLLRENIMLKAQDRGEEMKKPNVVIEKPYTVIVNHSATAYINRLEIPAAMMEKAIRWTDTNGVNVIDISMGSSFIRYVEGHIEPRQLSLYAPYLYIENMESED